MAEKMKGIVIQTNKDAFIEEYEEPLHKAVGRTVGGDIEIVHPRGLRPPYCMIVNEDGRYMDLTVNEVGSILYGYVIHGEPIMGDIVLMKDGMRNGEPDIVGLSDADIRYFREWLEERFNVLLPEATT